jgi:CelD/BcsL family acetyltransferase involved in cellulose biosynthesis
VTFRWVPPEEMSESILSAFFHLHGQRNAMRGLASQFPPTHREFHARLVARGRPGRGPAAVLAEHEGRTIGVRYGFLWLDVFAAFHMGWGPEWAPYSLGTALDIHGIRLARTAGARVYDLLRGDEDYKYRLGAVDRVDETWLVPTRLRGRLFGLKYRLKAGAGAQQ